MVLLVALIVLIYPTFRGQAHQLDQSLTQQIPQAARSLFTDTQDIFSPEGYMSSQLFYLTLPLILTILTIGLGGSLINREEQSGTLELLLARPLSRGKLLVSKFIVGVLVLGIVTAITLVTTVVTAQAVHLGIALSRLAEACVLSALLSLIFGMVTFTLNALGRFGKPLSLGLAVLIAFGSYLISSLDKTVHWLAWPAKVLPFHYYQPANVMSGTYDWRYGGAFVFAILILLAFCYIGFRRRDISS